MKFSTLQKCRMPASLVDYLLQPQPPIRQIQVGQGGLTDPDSFSVGKITKKGSEMQLAMLIPVKTTTGTIRTLRALIDTGAEANLIRQGVLESHYFRHAKDPISLIAANDQK